MLCVPPGLAVAVPLPSAMPGAGQGWGSYRWALGWWPAVTLGSRGWFSPALKQEEKGEVRAAGPLGRGWPGWGSRLTAAEDDDIFRAISRHPVARRRGGRRPRALQQPCVWWFLPAGKDDLEGFGDGGATTQPLANAVHAGLAHAVPAHAAPPATPLHLQHPGTAAATADELQAGLCGESTGIRGFPFLRGMFSTRGWKSPCRLVAAVRLAARHRRAPRRQPELLAKWGRKETECWGVHGQAGGLAGVRAGAVGLSWDARLHGARDAAEPASRPRRLWQPPC